MEFIIIWIDRIFVVLLLLVIEIIAIAISVALVVGFRVVSIIKVKARREKVEVEWCVGQEVSFVKVFIVVRTKIHEGAILPEVGEAAWGQLAVLSRVLVRSARVG